MRIFVLSLALALVSVVHAQELPIESILEDEVTPDIEVCQARECNMIRQQILVQAAKCRPLARFKERRMARMGRIRRGRKRGADSCKLFHNDNFKLSKGKCSAAFRAACEASGIDGRYLNVDAYNLQKLGNMEKAGFVNMIWKYNESTAPLGAILVYVGGVGHHYGHVEVRVNPNLFCSDHCNSHAVTAQSAATRARYKLAGVYLPFTSTIALTASNDNKPSPLKN